MAMALRIRGPTPEHADKPPTALVSATQKYPSPKDYKKSQIDAQMAESHANNKSQFSFAVVAGGSASLIIVQIDARSHGKRQNFHLIAIAAPNLHAYVCKCACMQGVCKRACVRPWVRACVRASVQSGGHVDVRSDASTISGHAHRFI